MNPFVTQLVETARTTGSIPSLWECETLAKDHGDFDSAQVQAARLAAALQFAAAAAMQHTTEAGLPLLAPKDVLPIFGNFPTGTIKFFGKA